MIVYLDSKCFRAAWFEAVGDGWKATTEGNKSSRLIKLLFGFSVVGNLSLRCLNTIL